MWGGFGGSLCISHLVTVFFGGDQTRQMFSGNI